MNIDLKTNYGYVLVFTAENVRIEEDADERIYDQLPDGKPDYKSKPFRDISDDVMEQFCSITGEIAGYRQREFDS